MKKIKLNNIWNAAHFNKQYMFNQMIAKVLWDIPHTADASKKLEELHLFDVEQFRDKIKEIIQSELTEADKHSIDIVVKMIIDLLK